MSNYQLNPNPSPLGTVVAFAVAVVVLIAVLCGIGFLVQGSDFVLYRYFSPKYEDVRRDTFEHSHAYNSGMQQELDNMRMEFLKQNDPSAKAAMADVILHRVGDYDEKKLSDDMRHFVRSIRRHPDTNPSLDY